MRRCGSDMTQAENSSRTWRALRPANVDAAACCCGESGCSSRQDFDQFIGGADKLRTDSNICGAVATTPSLRLTATPWFRYDDAFPLAEKL